MENCPCPAPAAIVTIPAPTCPEDLGQVVRLILTRQGNEIAATEAAAKLLATYTPLLSAVGDTKIQVTPKLMEAVVIPMGEPIKEGGDDNSTPLGRAIVVGASTIQVEGMLRGVDSAVIAAMKQLACESLDIALVNEFGQIAYNLNEDGSVRGFPAHAFFVGDKGNDGKNTQDKAKITWGFDAGWRNNMVLIKPTDFDPRFDL
jgi:hypothetical protein